MSKESLDNPSIELGLLKLDDDPERVIAIVEAAMDNGRQEGDLLHITIPIDPDMRLWGTGAWLIAEDGSMVGANDALSEYLSLAAGRKVNIYGVANVHNAETSSYDHKLLASVV